MNAIRTSYRKLAWGAGLFFALVLGLHFLLPILVNTSAVRGWILSQAAGRLSGDVDFSALKPALLPLPHAVVIQGRISLSSGTAIRFAEGSVYPRIWPLLTGRLILGRLNVEKPEIVVPLPERSHQEREKPEDRSFRSLAGKLHDILPVAARELGPMSAKIEDGRLTFSKAGQAGIEFTRIDLEADASQGQFELRINGRSNVLEKFDFHGAMDLHTLDGTGRIGLSGLKTRRLVSFGLLAAGTPIPEMTLEVGIDIKTQGLKTFDSGFQVKAPEVMAENGPRRLTVRGLSIKGNAHWTDQQVQLSLAQLHTASPLVELSGTAVWPLTGRSSMIPDQLRIKGVGLDVTEVRKAILQLAGNHEMVREIFDIVQGGRLPEWALSLSGTGIALEEIGKHIELQGSLTAGRIVVPGAGLHLEAVSGRVVLDQGRLSAENVEARLGNSVARNGSLKLGLMDGTKAFNLDTEIDADLSELPAILRKLTDSPEFEELLDRMPPIGGSATGRLQLGDRLDRITARITTKGRLEVLDAALKVSGTINGLPSADTSIQLALNGPMGPDAVEWLGSLASVPAELLPNAPITATRTRITWSPTGGFGLGGEFVLANGLSLSATLKVGQGELDVTNLHLKDATSDAVFTLRRLGGGKDWRAGFSGYLDRSAADKLLRRNNLVMGWLKGDLKAHLLTDAPEKSEVHGRLESRQIRIPLGSLGPLAILNASLAGKGHSLDFEPVELKWKDHNARVSGGVTFTSKAWNLNLAVSADSLDADKLLQDLKKEKPASGSQPTPEKNALPIRGKISIETSQLILGGYRFAPLQAVVALKADETTVDINAADLCGIAVPGQIRFNKDGLRLGFQPRAAGLALRDSEQCLGGTGNTERLEGTVDVQGSISSQGRSETQLINNLDGAVDIRISDGRIYNVGAAGFFTNLLAFISINQIVEGGVPDLRKNDLPYKSLSAKLALNNGVLNIEEGVLKSNAVNIVASGKYLPATEKVDLVLLVSPLTTVDWIVEKIPLLGNILQGTLVAIPVGVKGPALNPTVVPLSPEAVGSRLSGILKRTVNTPFRILSPLLKDQPK